MFSFVDGLKTAGAGVAGAALAALVTYPIAHNAGRDAERVQAITSAFEQLKERGLINEDVSGLDDCALLVELGGMSDDCAN